MELQSGTWIGIFVTSDGRAVQVTVKLKVKDDRSFTGEFHIYPSYPGNNLDRWHGPKEGLIKEGGYSPFGSIHFREDTEEREFGTARFNGRYESPTAEIGVMWGTVLIANGEKTEQGTLSLVHAALLRKDAGGVWGE